MGNDGVKKSSFEEHNWRNIEQTENRTILYNDITMKSVQKHEALLDCDEGQAITICKWRQSLPPDSGVVDLYQYGIKSSGMCTKQSNLYVITERIHLLSEIGSFSKPQAFIILRDIASGLGILFRKFGHFNPRPNIIGINSEGRAKIWTNENFALTEPIKQMIPVQQSELAIVNNLIRLLESKTYKDNSLPIDYPRNLDLNSVVSYVNKVFASLKGFEVDRVYIDRAQFTKKYKQLRQRTEKEQMSRMIASEAERKLKQIEILHENLRLQQAQLARKQQQLKLQNQYQQQLLRQQQMKRQLQIQRQTELQMQLQMRGQLITDNSQGKLLRGTASSYRQSIHTPVNSVSRTQIQQHVINQNQVPLQQINNGAQPNIFRQSVAAYAQPPLPPQQRGPSNQNMGARQPFPSRLIENQPNLIANRRPQTQDKQEKLKKQIEMVDSMILMQDEDPSEQNKRYIESRIITYQV